MASNFNITGICKCKLDLENKFLNLFLQTVFAKKVVVFSVVDVIFVAAIPIVVSTVNTDGQTRRRKVLTK